GPPRPGEPGAGPPALGLCTGGKAGRCGGPDAVPDGALFPVGRAGRTGWSRARWLADPSRRPEREARVPRRQVRRGGGACGGPVPDGKSGGLCGRENRCPGLYQYSRAGRHLSGPRRRGAGRRLGAGVQRPVAGADGRTGGEESQRSHGTSGLPRAVRDAGDGGGHRHHPPVQRSEPACDPSGLGSPVPRQNMREETAGPGQKTIPEDGRTDVPAGGGDGAARRRPPGLRRLCAERGGSIPASPRRDTCMLVLTRRRDESIMIGDDIRVTVVEVRGDQVKLGIDAPRSIPVHREEVYLETLEENRRAALSRTVDVANLEGVVPPRRQGEERPDAPPASP